MSLPSGTLNKIFLENAKDIVRLNKRNETSIKPSLLGVLDKILEEVNSSLENKRHFLEMEYHIEGMIDVDGVSSKVNGRIDIAVVRTEAKYKTEELFTRNLRLGAVSSESKNISCVIETKKDLNLQRDGSIVQLLAEMICLSTITMGPVNGILMVWW